MLTKHFRTQRMVLLILALFVMQAGAAINIIPRPYTVTEGTGSFTIPAAVNIHSDGTRSDSTIPWLKKLFENAGKTAQRVSSPDGAHILVKFIAPDANLGNEGYKLTITTNNVTIEAPTTTGQFYAVQSIRQLIPAAVERGASVMPSGALTLPVVAIVDKPHKARRGLMMDPARRFVPLSFLKETADRLALYKMNVLHLHLSDDQGFRMEVIPPAGATDQQKNAITNLTKVGASTQCGGGSFTNYFYTQKELRELVKYAADRKIMIVPEFDMPGHCHAALHSFYKAGLNLGQSNWGISSLYTGTGVGESFLDVSSSITPTVEFYISTLLKQVADVFPGEYLSIGADECYNFSKAGYSRAVRRMEEIINSLGRNMMGWEEIFTVVQNPKTISQAWKQGGSGSNIIYTRCERMYLDHPQRKGDGSTNDWCVPGGQVTISTTYSANSLVGPYLGVEATAWAEFMSWEKGYHDRQIFPRLLAVSEVGWTSPGRYSWDDFKVRAVPFGARMDYMGMSWYTAENQVAWQRAGTTYTNDLNVYSNWDWQATEIAPALTARQMQKKLGSSTLHVFDIKGRTMFVDNTQKVRNIEEISRMLPVSGVFIVKQNGIVTKIQK